MVGLTGYLLFLALLLAAVLNPSISPACALLALGVFSVWPVDVSK
jgi:hypothetical protein